MAIVDWMMPGTDGLELCRRIRADAAHAAMHVILLTSRAADADVVAGLDAGADDYLVKPFNPEELRARVQAGVRVLSLQNRLGARVRELQDALANVKELTGLLPICSYCKRSAATTITGSSSRRTSATTPTRTSATASARPVSTESAPNSKAPHHEHRDRHHPDRPTAADGTQRRRRPPAQRPDRRR
jgi:CheY-like chemotaxis protein